MQRFTNEEKRRCAARESAMRLKVYPRWVDSGRMTKREADHEIAVMAEIAEDYRAKAAAESPDLFNTEG